MRRKLFGNVLAYASHFESGDHTSPIPPRSMLAPPTSAVVSLPDATSTTRTRTSSSTKAMRVPSGDHVASHAIFDSPMGMRRASPSPSWGATSRTYPLPSSLNHATLLPSGDQTGSRSSTPELRVRLRVSPCSTGTVNTSPRAAMSARAPVGDSEADPTSSATSSQRGSAHGKSPRTVMSSFFVSPVAGSSVWIHPSCSNTSPSGPPFSHFTSASVKCVTWRSSLVPTSYDHTLLAQSRSETNQMWSPTHTG